MELLPVFQFDAQDCPPGKTNYWGYAPISLFAPHQAYSSQKNSLAVLDEFRDMVKALHRAGLEVILDVVYNHTAEGDHRGPTLCFRGLDNEAYYILEPDMSRYANYTGTGNTLNANDPIVRRMAERDLVIMGRAAKSYLDEQRAGAGSELQLAIDQIWRLIVQDDRIR